MTELNPHEYSKLIAGEHEIGLTEMEEHFNKLKSDLLNPASLDKMLKEMIKEAEYSDLFPRITIKKL